jgi:hypothetical protein
VVVLEQRCERRRRLVVADDRQQRRARAERRGVARDVAAPPGRSSARRIFTTGTGASGEMRSHVAEPVAVEHHVADDEHARLRDPRAPVGEPGVSAVSPAASPARARARIMGARSRSTRARGARQRGLVEVAPVEHERLAQRRAHRQSESWPRNSFHSVTIPSASRAGAGVDRRRREAHVRRAGEHATRLVHRDRVVGDDRRAARPSASMTTRDGASRMSSVLGLKESPHTANVLPRGRRHPGRRSCRPIRASARPFTSSTAARTFSSTPCCRPVCRSAFTSFGKQLPAVTHAWVQEVEADRGSAPMPWRTASTSAPRRSARFASSFMNEMRVASIALAAYFGELGGAHVHHQQPLVVALERRVDRAQRGDRALVVAPTPRGRAS